MTPCEPGDLVLLISPQTSLLKTSGRKFRAIFVGPLVVYKITD